MEWTFSYGLLTTLISRGVTSTSFVGDVRPHYGKLTHPQTEAGPIDKKGARSKL